MKIKGINPIEKHVEKLVLLVVGVVFLGVVAMQFLVSPNQVEVGSGRTANPDEIYGVLQERAEKLQAQIDDPSPNLPEVQRANLLEAYEAGVSSTPSVAPTIATWLERPSGIENLGGGAIEINIANGPVRAMAVPAPGAPIAFAQWNTLDPFAANAWPGLAGIGDGPADFVGVSIETAFPGAELMKSLSEVGEGERPVPRKLWQRGGLAILDVEVERQQRTADGGWSDPQPVHTAGPDALAELSPEPDPEVLMTLVRDVAESPKIVINPAYPPTISGDAWTAPSESLTRADRWANEAEADRIRARIAQIEDEMGSGGRRTTSARPPDRTGGVSDPRSTPPARNNPPANSTNTQDESRRRQIEQLEKRLADLGFGPEDDNDRNAGRNTRTRSSDAPELLASESVDVWAHDLNAEPGETYRYRVRVVLNNPLYQQNAVLDPDDASQQALADDAVTRGDWSTWTEPVDVPKRSYLFVTGVSTGDAFSGSTRVSGEVYAMYYGYYRKSPFTLELGDAVQTTASLPDTLVLFDTARVQETEAERLLEDLARRQEQAGDDRSSSGAVVVDVVFPEGATPVAGTLPMAYDAALVDVTQSMVEVREAALGQDARALVEAVFRAADGSLMVRTVGEDSGPVYSRVDASARRGARLPLERVVADASDAPAWSNPTGSGRDDNPRMAPSGGQDHRADPRDGP
ncbi:MAG: hypothetical protein DHS20C14_12540 [Phycisphaeraceae bacterium]|nr:MAG: hypothetical protein DHS20C14_12540 [Phycisphaeraceae bacterium]